MALTSTRSATYAMPAPMLAAIRAAETAAIAAFVSDLLADFA